MAVKGSLSLQPHLQPHAGITNPSCESLGHAGSVPLVGMGRGVASRAAEGFPAVEDGGLRQRTVLCADGVCDNVALRTGVADLRPSSTLPSNSYVGARERRRSTVADGGTVDNSVNQDCGQMGSGLAPNPHSLHARRNARPEAFLMAVLPVAPRPGPVLLRSRLIRKSSWRIL